MNKKDTLKELCSLPAVSGFELSYAEKLSQMLKPFVNKIDIDKFGTVTGIIICPVPNAPTIMLDAHFDQIGFIVTQILDGGFIRFSCIGGVDQRMLIGCEVTILSKSPIHGVICSIPPSLSNEQQNDKSIEVNDMIIDTGFLSLDGKVSIGTPIIFREPPIFLSDEIICSKCLDDRAGIYAILEALSKIKRQDLKVNVAVLFSCQEEVTSLGAITGAFKIKPDMAIAVDVSHAYTPDAPTDATFEYGGGTMIGVGPNMNKNFTNSLIKLAKAEQIKYQLEVMEGNTGTNAWNIQISTCGTAQALLSIPLKYMHTPIECVKLCDIGSTADLIAAFLKSYNGGNIQI